MVFLVQLLLLLLSPGAAAQEAQLQQKRSPDIVLGQKGENCREACQRAVGGRCREDPESWPQTKEDFEDIYRLGSLQRNRICVNGILDGGNPHDPSHNADFHCHWRTASHINGSDRCDAKPHGTDSRICFCDTPDETDSMLQGTFSGAQHAVGGRGLAKEDHVKADIQPVQLVDPHFPASPKVAVTFSGGGSRAMTGTMGALRALENLGLMKDVDIVSCVSGGCWGTGVYMFAEVGTDELLGPKTESLSQLNMDKLRNSPPKLAAGALKDMCPKVLDCVSPFQWDRKTPADQCWTDAVAYYVFNPFGLDDANGPRYMASSRERVKAAVARNPGVLTEDKFLVMHKDRPKRYVINGALESPEGGWYTEHKAASLQMGPDWSGVPFYPGGKQVTYTKPGWGPWPDHHLALTVGGGLESSYTAGGLGPVNKTDQRGGNGVLMSMPEKPITLAQAVGVSSSAFAYLATNIPLVDNVVPRMLHWPVTSDKLPKPQAARKFKTADGGILENLGLLPMLQRKVPKVALFVWTGPGFGIPDTDSYDFCNNFEPAGFDFTGKVSEDIAGKFGFFKHSSKWDYEHNRVFEEKDLGTLMCELQKKKAAKQPAVAQLTLAVQRNAWWGIEGGWDVELLVLYTDVVEDFQEALPSDTKKTLKDNRDEGELHGYPFLQTMGQHSSESWTCSLAGVATQLMPAEINLYAAQAEYSVTQNANAYSAFFKNPAKSSSRRLTESTGTDTVVLV